MGSFCAHIGFWLMAYFVADAGRYVRRTCCYRSVVGGLKGVRLKNQYIVLLTDNAAVVYIVQTLTCGVALSCIS